MPRKNLKKLVTKTPKSRNAAPSSWTRDQLEALIEEMKQRPELYGNSRPNLGDTKKSLMDLTKALKPVRPNVTMEDVKSHIRAIRDQYYHEVARLEKNKKMNINDDTPRLWCFSKLSFLNETGGCLQDSDEDHRSESPMSDKGVRARDNRKWARGFLEKYLQLKSVDDKANEHKAFLKYVRLQLEKITDFDILARTKVGVLHELEAGVSEQKLKRDNGEIGTDNESNPRSASDDSKYNFDMSDVDIAEFLDEEFLG